MRIIELRSTNVKRLSAVEIKPDGSSLVIIGGANGNGKTSVLDSIMYAMGGKGCLPPKPVREGQDEAVITVNLGEFVVMRTITADGKGSLTVKGKDGGKYASPQTILDNLVGNLSFDPLAFSRMDPKGQVETLKHLVGLDFSAIDRRKAAKTDERLLVGREVKQLEGQLKGMPAHQGAPGVEVSVAELSARLGDARRINKSNESERIAFSKAEAAVRMWEERIGELKTELAAAETAAADGRGYVTDAKKGIDALKDVDEQAILDQIANAEGINRKVRDNQGRVRIAQQVEQKEAAYDTLSKEIQALDAEKARALESANFPVEGLSFDETGVLVKGVPFQQASAAEQLRVSVAMGLALNPKLKVLLVRDGSLLDAKSLAMVAEMADKAGGQVWLERVGEADASAVIIEDGMVAERKSRKVVAGGVR